MRWLLIAVVLLPAGALAQSTSFDRFMAPPPADPYATRPLGTLDYGLGSSALAAPAQPSGTIDYGLNRGATTPPPQPLGTIDYGLSRRR